MVAEFKSCQPDRLTSVNTLDRGHRARYVPFDGHDKAPDPQIRGLCQRGCDDLSASAYSVMAPVSQPDPSDIMTRSDAGVLPLPMRWASPDLPACTSARAR